MRKYFLTGLVILLPLAVTVMIVAFIVNFLTQPFIGLTVEFLSSMSWGGKSLSTIVSPKVIWYGSRLVILIVLFLFTLLLGMFARWFFIRSILKVSERIMGRIPLVNKIYKTTKEIIKTFFSNNSQSFKKVVLVPFPSSNTYCVGLVSREAPPLLEQELNEKLVSVFIPTTPNPTSGFILLFRTSDIIELPIRTEDALKFIVSCGVIHPDALKAKKPPKSLTQKKKAKTPPKKASSAKKAPVSKKVAEKKSAAPSKNPSRKVTARAVKKSTKKKP